MNTFSTIILFAIVVLVSSEEIPEDLGCKKEILKLEDCASEHQTYITKTLSKVNGSEILNPEFMKTFLNFTTQLATCIGLDNKCDNSRHYKYFSDALTFLGNTVYDSEVFACLQNISGPINTCIPNNHRLVSNVKKSHNKNFIRCVYRELGTVPTCKIPRVSKKMCSAAQTLRHIIKNYLAFKSDSMEVKVFNPEKLDKCTS
ncbi:unnamed protein product [Caenorhabditis brenneri]